jgi:hypothetical protein
MNFSIMLDVIIGMVFIYLVFSLLASAINEAIAAMLDSRSKWLAHGLQRLLQEPGKPKQADLVDALFAQPLLSQLGRRPLTSKFLGTPHGRSPNSIPPDLALPALLNSALSAGASSVVSKVYASVADIDAAVAAMPESALKANVLQLRTKGQVTLVDFEADFKAWFEDFGEEIGGWYRQKTHYVLLWIGFALAFAANLDSISLFRQLSLDPGARASLVKAAMAQAKLTEPSLTEQQAAVSAAQSSLNVARNDEKVLRTAASQCEAALPKDPAKDAAKVAACKTGVEAAIKLSADLAQKLSEARASHRQEVDKLTATLYEGGIKLGWDHGPAAKVFDLWSPSTWTAPLHEQFSLLKLLGLFLSGLALSLGAPVWFDLLKNLTSIRSVGLTRAESASKKKKSA